MGRPGHSPYGFYTRDTQIWELHSIRGRIDLLIGATRNYTKDFIVPRSFYVQWLHLPANPNIYAQSTDAKFWERIGFGWQSQRFDQIGSSIHSIGVSIPHWFLLIAFALLPTVHISRYRTLNRRRSEKRCPTCGYDLRATPNRLPECGTISQREKQNHLKQN